MILLVRNDRVEFMNQSTETGEFGKEAEARTGSKVYEIEGVDIGLGWQKFSPKKPTIASSDEATIFLPGWSAKVDTKAVDILGQAFADNSHLPTYAVVVESAQVTDDSLYKEAKAILEFLQEKGSKKITLAGHSEGGSRAINLAVLLQEMQKVDPSIEIRGLILMDSAGLYGQDSGRMSRRFAYDSLIGTSLATARAVGSSVIKEVRKGKSIKKALAQSWQANQVPQTLNVGSDSLFGVLKEVGQMAHLRSGYLQRLGSQVREMVTANPRISLVKTPVVLVWGAEDPIMEYKRIIPPAIEGQVIRRRQEIAMSKQTGGELSPQVDFRENFLKENLFTSSPYVKMVVAQKAGRHVLPIFRSQAVARAGLYLLERGRRQLDTSQLQNTTVS